MAGILIYTAAPDSEGTLGGLVTLGETANLEQHLDQALEGLEICSFRSAVRGDVTRVGIHVAAWRRLP